MWQNPSDGEIRSIQEVLQWILDARTGGLVVSGGEPLMQCGPLEKLMRQIPESAGMGKILYTGYTWPEVLQDPARQKVSTHFDVLVCGPYIEEQNDSKGLRGSSNQEVIFQTSRYIDCKKIFLQEPRRVEVEIHPEFTRVVGIAPAGMNLDFNHSAGGQRVVID